MLCNSYCTKATCAGVIYCVKTKTLFPTPDSLIGAIKLMCYITKPRTTYITQSTTRKNNNTVIAMMKYVLNRDTHHMRNPRSDSIGVPPEHDNSEGVINMVYSYWSAFSFLSFYCLCRIMIG